MPSPQFVLVMALIAGVFPFMAYITGLIPQRLMAMLAVPAFSVALAAVVMVNMAPPPPPLSAAEQAKQNAAGSGYALGLATGMMVGH